MTRLIHTIREKFKLYFSNFQRSPYSYFYHRLISLKHPPKQQCKKKPSSLAVCHEQKTFQAWDWPRGLVKFAFYGVTRAELKIFFIRQGWLPVDHHMFFIQGMLDHAEPCWSLQTRNINGVKENVTVTPTLSIISRENFTFSHTNNTIQYSRILSTTLPTHTLLAK